MLKVIISNIIHQSQQENHKNGIFNLMGFIISFLEGILLLVWVFSIYVFLVNSLGIIAFFLVQPLLVIIGTIILIVSLFNGIKRSKTNNNSLTKTDFIFLGIVITGIIFFASLAFLMFNLNKTNPSFHLNSW